MYHQNLHIENCKITISLEKRNSNLKIPNSDFKNNNPIEDILNIKGDEGVILGESRREWDVIKKGGILKRITEFSYSLTTEDGKYTNLTLYKSFTESSSKHLVLRTDDIVVPTTWISLWKCWKKDKFDKENVYVLCGNLVTYNSSKLELNEEMVKEVRDLYLIVPKIQFINKMKFLNYDIVKFLKTK